MIFRTRIANAIVVQGLLISIEEWIERLVSVLRFTAPAVYNQKMQCSANTNNSFDLSALSAKTAGGRRHTPHFTLPPRSAPGHKLQKSSKESGIFQSLGTINFVNSLLKDKVKNRGPGGGMAQRPP